MKIDNSLTQMRIEISIDPDTLEYEVSLNGDIEVIKTVLVELLDSLENEEITDQLIPN